LAFWLVIFGWQAVESLHAWMLAIAGGSGVVSLLGASPISPALSEALKGVKLSVARLIALASIVFLACLAIWTAHGSMLLLEAIARGLMLPLEAIDHGSMPLLKAIAHGLIDRVMLEPLGCLQLSAVHRTLVWTAIAALVLFGFSFLATYFVNVNYFSLNAMYRNRLVRSFLGASHTAKDRNPFDGFADSDNLAMDDLRRPNNPGLFHVVNITLNLTATENNAWQERKAAPFICTPLHTGGHDVGYRPSKTYCDKITLGTAARIGAITRPRRRASSCRYSTRAWAGGTPTRKPPPPGRKTVRTRASAASFRRRWVSRPTNNPSSICPTVGISRTWASTRWSGADVTSSSFVTLARTRAARLKIWATPSGRSTSISGLKLISNESTCALEIIVRQSAVFIARSGAFAIPTRTRKRERSSPADVKAYAAADAKFPHDGTLNQWFTESQFESYRALGEHAIKMMTGLRDSAGKTTDWPPHSPSIVDLLDFCQRVEDYLQAREASAGDSA